MKTGRGQGMSGFNIYEGAVLLYPAGDSHFETCTSASHIFVHNTLGLRVCGTCACRACAELQMSAKQSRIEKLKLEIKKLEAERDGLKQVRTGHRRR